MIVASLIHRCFWQGPTKDRMAWTAATRGDRAGRDSGDRPRGREYPRRRSHARQPRPKPWPRSVRRFRTREGQLQPLDRLSPDSLDLGEDAGTPRRRWSGPGSGKPLKQGLSLSRPLWAAPALSELILFGGHLPSHGYSVCWILGGGFPTRNTGEFPGFSFAGVMVRGAVS